MQRRRLAMAGLLAGAYLFFSGCQSDLDRCIDSQMAVWEQKRDKYEEFQRNHDPSKDVTVNIGGMPMTFSGGEYPGTEEEARARAYLRCGKYANN